MDEKQLQSEEEKPVENIDYLHWEAVLEVEPRKFVVVNQKDYFNKELEFRPSYEELPRENLRIFRMVTPEGQTILQIPFKDGQGPRLIWRRRRSVAPGGGEVWFYVVGKKGAFVNVIMPDLSIVSDDNFSEDNVLLSDIVPVRGEEGFVE